MANNVIFEWAAGSFEYPATNPAPFDLDTGTNGMIGRQRFDDTTEEQVKMIISELPSNLDTAGTVTFVFYGYAVTAAASKNVEFTIYHSAKNNGENWDAAYSTKITGDKVPDATQDELDRFTVTETVANLGWAASDFVRLKIGRTAPAGTNLSGDYGLTGFAIYVPVTVG